MYKFTKKDLLSSGDIVTTWPPDYEEFDVDLSPNIQQALIECEGNYYVAEIDTETNTPVFPDEQALVLDLEYERINETFTWLQIKEFLPDEDVSPWGDESFNEEDWDWENDIE